MDSRQMIAKWNDVRDRVQEQWDKLSEEDLDEVAGSRDRLVGKIEEKYGFSHEEAELQVDSFPEEEIEDA